MQVLERLRYILEVARIPAAVDCLLKILIIIVSHSPEV